MGAVIDSKDPANEITFTSGGTEVQFQNCSISRISKRSAFQSNHWALHCSVAAFKNAEKTPHVITSNIEHPALEMPLLKLQASGKIGFRKTLK